VWRSPDEVGKFLASDFIEFGSSGTVYSRQQILDALTKETPMELSATDFSVWVLCDDFVLVTYRATLLHGSAAGRSQSSASTFN
jgi:hypothetical protein